jgi:hypothetical protein
VPNKKKFVPNKKKFVGKNFSVGTVYKTALKYFLIQLVYKLVL